jgi:lipid-A-disaccharide synthase
MRSAGVRTIVDAADLAVVGLVEVVAHIPRIYAQFRKLCRAAATEKPDLAILTDSPDFHLRLARKLKTPGVPVIYLVAPQVWAWRKGRIPGMRRSLKRLLCIFPFEEDFFRKNGISADYIGHPLTRIVRPSLSKEVFLRKHGIDQSRPLIAILPGSRVGEVSRHLPALVEAAQRLHRDINATLLLAAPIGFGAKAGPKFFWERIGSAPIQVIEGETWDTIAHADLALAASGTVTVEAALLGTPMITFYRVTGLSWWMGRLLVNVPFYSMVNLVAGRKVVPEYMQNNMTGAALADAAKRLLGDGTALEQMRAELKSVASHLATREDPMDRAAEIVAEFVDKEIRHGS